MAKKTKFKRYQQQLLDRLVADGWELVEIAEQRGEEIHEHWTIRSVRASRGLELVISFGEEYYGFWGVTASTPRPEDLRDEAIFARLDLGSTPYHETVVAFVAAIDERRRAASVSGEAP